MNRSVLVAYATKHGSTCEVAEAVAAVLRERGLEVDVQAAADVDDLRPYGGVVLGGALYTGRWHRDARRFLARHSDALDVLPVAVFAMGPRTLDEQDVSSSRAQLDRALGQVPDVVPVSVAIFGGVVRPETLRFPFNRMPASDARDWDAVHAWAEEVAARLDAPGRLAAPVPAETR